MAKKSNRLTYPFRCEKCGSQRWTQTNRTNNQVAGITKMTIKLFCNHADCRTHRTFTESKRPSTVQQGGKKKR